MIFAFSKWSEVANVNFKELDSDDADLLVSFIPAGLQSDKYHFDGPGGAVARAFYPNSGAGISISSFMVEPSKAET